MSDNRGIWDVPNSEELGQRIQSLAEAFCESNPIPQTSDEVDVTEVVVFGSYGRGTATPGSSDLDVLITTSTTAARTSKAYSDYLPGLATHIESHEQQILAGFRDYFTGVDVLVYPEIERDKHLASLAEKHDASPPPETLAYSFRSGKISVLYP